MSVIHVEYDTVEFDYVGFHIVAKVEIKEKDLSFDHAFGTQEDSKNYISDVRNVEAYNDNGDDIYDELPEEFQKILEKKVYEYEVE